jgi:hypothetical protein
MASLDNITETGDTIVPYLSSTAFSENIAFSADSRRAPVDRADLIVEMARGKSVVHVGCVDHLQDLPSKIAAGTWFHGRLSQAASRCIGIDINRSGIEMLRSRWGIANVEFGDIATDGAIESIKAHAWDWIVLGEVLEHIDNPVQFLTGIAKNYSCDIRGIVISVPNAFRGGNLINIFRNRELINSDHRYWFSPYTLQKVAYRSGIEPTSLSYCHYGRGGRAKMLLKDFICSRLPLLCANLVLVGRFTSSVQSRRDVLCA